MRSFWRGFEAWSSTNQRGSYYLNSLPDLLLNLPLETDDTINELLVFGRTSASGSFSLRASLDRKRRTKQETLIDLLTARVHLGDELETYLVSFPNRERRNLTSFYRVVASAYAKHPEYFADRYEELSLKLLENSANDHDFTLWLLLSNESNTTLSSELENAFRERLTEIHWPTRLQMLNIAKILARLESYELAVEYYETLAIDLAEYSSVNNTGPFFASSPFASTEINVLALIKEASALLPLESSRGFVERVLVALAPFTEVAEYKNIYDAFTLHALSVVYPKSEVLAETQKYSRSLTNAVDKVTAFRSIPLIELAQLHGQNGEHAKALATIKPLFSWDNISASKQVTSNPLDADGFSSSYTIMQGVEQMASFLGLPITTRNLALSSTAAPSSASFFIAMHEAILSIDDNQWLDTLTAAFVSWLDDPLSEQDAILEALCVLAYELHTRGELDAASNVAHQMQRWLLEQSTELSKEMLQSFSLIVPEIEFVVQPALANVLFRSGLLSTEDQIHTLRSLEQTHAASRLLELAQVIDAENSGLATLQEIRRIARAAGDETYVEELELRIQSLEEAKALLETAVL